MPDITAPIVNFATDQVGAYGVLAVFLLMILESACIPVPSEAIMLYGGFLVGRGDESLFWIVAAGVGGQRDRLVDRLLGGLRSRAASGCCAGTGCTSRPSASTAADRWFDRYGDWAVLLSRCLPIIRTFISLPAGIARMPFWRFTILTLIGCIPWVLMLAFAGRAVGDNWESLQQQLHYVDYVLAAAIIGGDRLPGRAPAAPAPRRALVTPE